MLFLIFIGILCLLTVKNPLGIPQGSPGDYQEIDGPVPEPYRTGFPRDPAEPPTTTPIPE